MTSSIDHIVIVGSNVYAWMAAAMLSRSVVGKATKITVIENVRDADFGGEPLAHSLVAASTSVHKTLGIKESRFVEKASATFKLANHYRDWSRTEHSFYFAQQPYGMMMDSIEFHQILIKLKLAGQDVKVDDYSLAAQVAKHGKFSHARAPRNNSKQLFQPYANALHVEADGYLAVIKKQVEENVDVVVGDIDAVHINKETHFIESIELKCGKKIAGDFFFDASDQGRALLEKTQNFERQSLESFLHCDRVVSASVVGLADVSPCSELSVVSDGWRRVIPLQNKTVVEFYYSSKNLADKNAEKFLVDAYSSHIESLSLREVQPNRLREFWRYNCIAIGNAAGQLGDFVVSNIHLTQSAILRFMDFYPLKSCAPSLANEYNKITAEEWDRILDLDCLHFCLVKGQSSVFWQRVSACLQPESLVHKLALFRNSGHFPFYERETFSKNVWIAFLLGHDVWPAKYTTLLEGKNFDKLKHQCDIIEATAKKIVNQMPSHARYLTDYRRSISQIASQRVSA